MSESCERKPHAVMDIPSRSAKGLKIERLLKLAPSKKTLRILDIGTGNGGIAHYFASHESLMCAVTSVDVVDQRKLLDGYDFVKLDGTALPFDDGAFDVVISNHVIEHVGPVAEQLRHLEEVRRVMAPGGVAYLAVPNRWMLIEPHYQLAFLSWLPRSLRSPYLRLRGRGGEYDCEPLTVLELERLFGKVGLNYKHLHVESIREYFTIEGAHGLFQLVGNLPDWTLCLLRWMNPTLIFVLKL